MTRTDEFAKDMRRELMQLHPEFEWKCSASPEPGCEHVDLRGIPLRRDGTESAKGRHILIEVELRRLSPASNLIKIWRWSEAKKFGKNPVIVQAFSKFYKHHRTHRENAEFVGRQMRKASRIKYHAIAFGYNPREGGKIGAGRRHYHAVELARTVSIAVIRKKRI